jgi:tetratricopeptide (TPR) repeat protein
VRTSVAPHLIYRRSQLTRRLASIAVERGDLEAALGFAHRAVHYARKKYAEAPESVSSFSVTLQAEADILESLGRLDEALALDDEWRALNPGSDHPELRLRMAIKHIAAGEDAEAEQCLRNCVFAMRPEWCKRIVSQKIESTFREKILLAELLERRGTEEALAEARTLRDEVAERLARHEARRAAALEDTRAAAAEAVRQCREERIKVIEKKAKGKGKSGKKGKRGKGKEGSSAAAAAIDGEPPREPAGGEVDGAAAVEGAAAAEAEQQAQVEESQSPEEEAREECAICMQDLELEDDEDVGDEGGEGEAIVVLRCGHRFHEVCGDMWCAKCADKGWGVTCPRCRAAHPADKNWWPCVTAQTS